mmetsp:Transcript_3849/g.8334  ORF Transcript_3849/g.8334 Transcript_3849/m.8334 type:complete len:260 (+) Transcript_3849:964-1743(+)
MLVPFQFFRDLPPEPAAAAGFGSTGTALVWPRLAFSLRAGLLVDPVLFLFFSFSLFPGLSFPIGLGNGRRGVFSFVVDVVVPDRVVGIVIDTGIAVLVIGNGGLGLLLLLLLLLCSPEGERPIAHHDRPFRGRRRFLPLPLVLPVQRRRRPHGRRRRRRERALSSLASLVVFPSATAAAWAVAEAAFLVRRGGGVLEDVPGRVRFCRGSSLGEDPRTGTGHGFGSRALGRFRFAGIATVVVVWSAGAEVVAVSIYRCSC